MSSFEKDKDYTAFQRVGSSWLDPAKLMTAKYDGICSACDKAYKSGDPIYWHFRLHITEHQACHRRPRRKL